MAPPLHSGSCECVTTSYFCGHTIIQHCRGEHESAGMPHQETKTIDHICSNCGDEIVQRHMKQHLELANAFAEAKKKGDPEKFSKAVQHLLPHELAHFSLLLECSNVVMKGNTQYLGQLERMLDVYAEEFRALLSQV